MRLRPRLIVASVVASLLGALLTVVTPVGVADDAAAATASSFDPGYIISDEQFFDGGAMSASQVQAFIDTKHPGCTAGYTCLDTYSQATPSMSADSYCAALPGRANESAASGHMCQISAKPQTNESTESTTPEPVFSGMWMAWKPDSGRL